MYLYITRTNCFNTVRQYFSYSLNKKISTPILQHLFHLFNKKYVLRNVYLPNAMRCIPCA